MDNDNDMSNQSTDMDFIAATDILFAHVRQEQLAKAMKISVASIRQARLSRDARAYRTPPPGWQPAVIMLAEQHAKQLSGLAEKLRAEGRQ